MIPFNGLQDMVDALAGRLQRSVAIDDPEIRLIVASRHFGDEDPVRVKSVLGREVDHAITMKVHSFGVDTFTGPARIPAMPEFAAEPRVCVPVRCSEALVGYLWLIDDGRLTDEDLADANSVAERAGLILYRRELALERHQSHIDALPSDLVSSDGHSRALAATELVEDGLVPDLSRATAIVLTIGREAGKAPDAASRSAEQSAFQRLIRRATRATADGSALSTHSGRRVIVLIAGHSDSAQQFATDAAQSLVGELAAGYRATAGIGSTVGELGRAHISYQQAVVATRAAAHLPGMGGVASWDSLGVFALLARLGPQELAATEYPAPLLRLVGRRNARVLITTVEVFLDSAGDAQRTARALHIHRTTLYQRLRRIEQLSGVDFGDGADRLTLHVSIKLAHLTGAFTWFDQDQQM